MTIYKTQDGTVLKSNNIVDEKTGAVKYIVYSRLKNHALNLPFGIIKELENIRQVSYSILFDYFNGNKTLVNRNKTIFSKNMARQGDNWLITTKDIDRIVNV